MAECHLEAIDCGRRLAVSRDREGVGIPGSSCGTVAGSADHRSWKRGTGRRSFHEPVRPNAFLDRVGSSNKADYRATTAVHVPPVLAEVAGERGHVGSAGGPAEQAEAILVQVADEAGVGDSPFWSLLKAAGYELW